MTDPALIEQELEDFSVFGLGNTKSTIDNIAGVIAETEQSIGSMNVPGQSDTVRHLQELLGVYKAQAAQAGIDMNAVSAAVQEQEGARGEHQANAPTDDEIAEAERAVTDAKTALANGTGTQQDVDAAVTHLSDLMKRRKDADTTLKYRTNANAESLKTVGDDNPKAMDKEKMAELLSKALQPQQQGAPQGQPQGQPQPQQGAQGSGSPQGSKGATPNTSKTPFSLSDLEKVLGRPLTSPSMPRATPANVANPSTVATQVSSGPSDQQNTGAPGTTISGLNTPENVSGRTTGSSPYPQAPPSSQAAAAGARPAGMSPMGGMPMGGMPMGGQGGGGESNRIEKPKIVHKDDEINQGKSARYAADGGVINEKGA